MGRRSGAEPSSALVNTQELFSDLFFVFLATGVEESGHVVTVLFFLDEEPTAVWDRFHAYADALAKAEALAEEAGQDPMQAAALIEEAAANDEDLQAVAENIVVLLEEQAKARAEAEAAAREALAKAESEAKLTWSQAYEFVYGKDYPIFKAIFASFF